MKKFASFKQTLALAAGVGVGVFAVVALVQAATTISTNISTDGTLASGATTITGAATISTTLGVSGLSTLAGFISTASSTLSSTINVTGAATLASTTATSFKVGNAGTQHSAFVSGYCSFADTGSFTASTTKYVDCTTTPASVLVAGDRVFVQATSSMDSPFVIQAASTTGVSTINLRILNTGLDGTADTTLGGTSINFWAVR